MKRATAAASEISVSLQLKIITRFKVVPECGAPYGGLSLPSGTKFAHKKLETVRYHTVKTWVSILPGTKVRYRVVTERRTDRSGIASTRLALHACAVVHKSIQLTFRKYFIYSVH